MDRQPYKDQESGGGYHDNISKESSMNPRGSATGRTAENEKLFQKSNATKKPFG